MERTIYKFDSLPDLPPSPLLRVPASPSRTPAPRHSPRVGVIYNRRSHRNRGQDIGAMQRPGITVAQPRERGEIAQALAGFAADGIDYLIINGGDGTVRDVLTMGQSVFGRNWPVIAVLPKGKTNALTVDLGAPHDWSLSAALAAWTDGGRIVRRPLAVHAPDGPGGDGPPVLGFILGAGAFTLGTRAGQDAHALGLFDSLAVGATGLWGVLQSLFGTDRNQWRRGTPMTLHALPHGEALPHSRHGDPARRNIMLASTLQRLPLGIRPFAEGERTIRVALMDKPLRRLMASLPAVLMGWRPKWLSRAGLHQVNVDRFEFAIGEEFILDGEAFPAGTYRIEQGPELTFVTP